MRRPTCILWTLADRSPDKLSQQLTAHCGALSPPVTVCTLLASPTVPFAQNLSGLLFSRRKRKVGWIAQERVASCESSDSGDQSFTPNRVRLWGEVCDRDLSLENKTLRKHIEVNF